MAPPFLTAVEETASSKHRTLFASRPKFECASTLPALRLDLICRDDLRAYALESRALQDLLFSAITEETAFFTNPNVHRNLLIFYYGHPSAFCVQQLVRSGLAARGVDERIEYMFEAEDAPQNRNESSPLSSRLIWPSVDEVRRYRDSVLELLLEAIEHVPLESPGAENGQFESTPLWHILTAIEHERDHFESTALLLRQLPETFLQRPIGWNSGPLVSEAPKNTLFAIPAGVVHLGKRRENPSFGWDADYGSRTEIVQPFSAGKFLVTNGEFLDFIRDGGYESSYFWSGEAWHWRSLSAARLPKYWNLRDGEIRYRGVFDETPLPSSWPAEVNYYEAEAFCRWKGPEYRLMTEGEWNHIADDHGSEERHAAGNDPCFGSGYNFGLRYGSPWPVNFGRASEFGLFDVQGNVWQWLSTSFAPLPGFRPSSNCPENANLRLDARRRLIVGGSWATTGAGTSKFRRRQSEKSEYHNAGFRLAKNY